MGNEMEISLVPIIIIVICSNFALCTGILY